MGTFRSRRVEKFLSDNISEVKRGNDFCSRRVKFHRYCLNMLLVECILWTCGVSA